MFASLTGKIHVNLKIKYSMFYGIAIPMCLQAYNFIDHIMSFFLYIMSSWHLNVPLRKNNFTAMIN